MKKKRVVCYDSDGTVLERSWSAVHVGYHKQWPGWCWLNDKTGVGESTYYQIPKAAVHVCIEDGE